MDDAARHERNKEKLGELHPWMRQRVMGLLVDLEHHGWKPRIQDAWRSPEDQLKAFNSGHSKLKYGYHNITGPNGEKESFACDILREDSTVLVAEREYCIALAHYAQKQELRTGITWGVPKEFQLAIDAAVKLNDTTRPIKIGWDPCHVEPNTGWTLSELATGWRPGFVNPPNAFANMVPPLVIDRAKLEGYCEELTTLAAKAADLRNRIQGHLK